MAQKEQITDDIEIIHPKRGVWQTYDVTNGLPAGIQCLLQDRQGYLWLGTNGAGLCRYDGAKFVIYTTADGLADNNVLAICEDQHERLWIGTLAGVSCAIHSELNQKDGQRFQTYTTADGLADNHVSAIYKDSREQLWFGTYGGISCAIHSEPNQKDRQRFQTYTTADGLADNHTRAIYEDHLGRLWFGTGEWNITGSGVSCFDGHRFQIYTTADGLVHDRVWVICEDHQEQLWFGTWGKGVSCVVCPELNQRDGHRFQTYTTANGLVDNFVSVIYEDRQGRLWFGTERGVSCFDGYSFTNYTTEDGLLNNRVTAIIQDREGNLWFAHKLNGLTRFDPETLQILCNSPVSETLIQDKQGNLWFGNEYELCSLSWDPESNASSFSPDKGCLNGNQHSIVKRCKAFNDAVYSLLEDSKGFFWVGTTGDGLYCYDSVDAVWDSAGKHFTNEDNLGDNNLVMSLLEARDGTIWVGTANPGYLCRFNPSTCISKTDEKAFEAIITSHPTIARLFEDGQGLIWMGGWAGGGLSCVVCPKLNLRDNSIGSGASLHNYTMEDGLPSNHIQSIVEDDIGRLWVGTQQGVCCFNGKQFATYGKSQGLFSLFCQCSTKDSTGQLWFGTLTGGLYRTDGKHFQWLTIEDGLLSNSITGLLPQPDNSMIIGTYHGIVHYRPTATTPPKIEIRELVADKVYSYPTSLELTTTQADLLTISYHGLSFTTRRMRYSYILEREQESEDLWQDTWENYVRYEKLPIGEYTFKVIAINRDLVTSETPAELKLKIIPDPLNHQIAQLKGELAERERAEMERIHKELEDARQIQKYLLPENPPEIENFEIAGISLPAREVSGDFYNYLSLGENTGIVLADVCGKSVRAAMVAVMTSSILNSEINAKKELWKSPGEILQELNAGLHPHLTSGMYTAMSLSILCPAEKQLVFSNAGVPYPIVKRGNTVWELKVNGLPLGILNDENYEDMRIDLQGGDFVIFCSDGVIESTNESEEEYQTDRLLEVIKRAEPILSAQEMLELILKDVTAFTGDVEAFDDITVVVLRCKGKIQA